jgi:hypothetical protein
LVGLNGETRRFERRIFLLIWHGVLIKYQTIADYKIQIVMKDWVCAQKLGTYLVATSDPTIPFNAMLEMASMIAGPLGRQEHSKAALYRRREGSRRRLLLINWKIGAI